MFEAGGSKIAGENIGLDRFWSDVSMFALHASIAVKEREIGEYALWSQAAVPSANG